MMSYKEFLKKEKKEDCKLSRLEYEAKSGNEKAFDDYAKVLSGELDIDDVVFELETDFGSIVDMFVAIAKVLDFKVKDIEKFTKNIADFNREEKALYVHGVMSTCIKDLFAMTKMAFTASEMLRPLMKLDEVLNNDK